MLNKPAKCRRSRLPLLSLFIVSSSLILTACGAGTIPSVTGEPTSESSEPTAENTESDVLTESAATPSTGAAQPEAQIPDTGTAQPETPTEPSPQIGSQTQSAADIAAQTWSARGPFNDQAEQAVSAYSGNSGLATIDVNTAGIFIETALRGYFNHSVEDDFYDTDAYAYNGLSILDDVTEYGYSMSQFDIEEETPASGTFTCSNSGYVIRDVATVTSTSGSRTVVKSSFDNCSSTLLGLHGDVSIAFQGTSTSPEEVTIAFDNARFSITGKKPIYLTGTHSKSFQCDAGFMTQSTVLVSSGDASDQLLIEDFVRSTDRGQALNCDPKARHLWDKVEGRISDSRVGAALITTPDALTYTQNPEYFERQFPEAFQAATDENVGKVVVSGRTESTASMTFSPNGFVHRYDGKLLPIADITLSSLGVDAKYKSTAAAFDDGVLSDLRDTDNDGIPNSWERFYSLDALDGTDATHDVDMDEHTAVQEYSRLMNPTGADQDALVIDQSISVSVFNDTIVNGEAVSQRVYVKGELPKALNPVLNPVNHTYTVTLSSQGVWDESRLPAGCTITTDLFTVECGYDYKFETSFTSEPLYVNSSGTGELTVSAAFSAGVSDVDPGNNVEEQVIDLVVVQDDASDFSIEAPVVTTGEDVYSTSIDVKISQKYQTDDHDVDVIGEFTDGMVFDSVQIIWDQLQPDGMQDCELNATRFVCELLDVGVNDNIEVSVTFKVESGSDHRIDWRLQSPDTGAQLDNDTATTIVENKLSAQRLRSILQDAPKGSTVVLPSGDYVGQILLPTNSRLRILGAEAPEVTRLFSYDDTKPMFIGTISYASIGRIDMHSTGAPIAKLNGENLTIHDSLFTPVEGMPHSLEQIVVSRRTESYRLLNNRIEGWGQGADNLCSGMVLHQKWADETEQTAIFLERNTFLNNECDSLIVFGSDTNSSFYSTANIYVNNNTFVGNPNVFRLSDGLGFEDFYVINNIFTDATNLLVIDDLKPHTDDSDYFNEVDGIPRIVSSMNILSNNDRATLFTSEMQSRTEMAVESADIETDPLFTDSAAGDFSLQSISPAIDAGVDPYPYYWTYEYPADASVYTITHPFISAIDGLGDGSVEFDVGAVEYTP